MDSLVKLSKKENTQIITLLNPPANTFNTKLLYQMISILNKISEDLINFKEGKRDIEIEFDIADDFATNQYLEVNKKTGFTEMIDSNLRMAPGGEDVIKDDFITWPIEKTDDIDYKTIADDYMHDYMSIPNDTDYSHLFERYVDSFSPAGNIFRTNRARRPSPL